MLVGLIAMSMAVDGLACRAVGCTRPVQVHLVSMASRTVHGDYVERSER